MGKVTCAQCCDYAAAECRAAIFNPVAENTAKAQDRKSNQIVQHAHDQCIQDQHSITEVAGLEGGGNRLGADGHFDHGIGHAGYQTPFDTVAIGDQHYRQHADQCDLSAKGQFGDEHFADQLQHDGDSQQHGAFRQSFGFVCHGNTSKNKNTASHPSGCNAIRQVSHLCIFPSDGTNRIRFTG